MSRILLPVFCILYIQANAQLIKDTAFQTNWNLHAQVTVIPQYHFNFNAGYSGNNSLLTSEKPKVSVTNTYYIGRRLWKNAAVYFNPEIAGGKGLSSAVGIAGFANGETFRIGSPQLKLYMARLYVEQKFAIGEGTKLIEDDLNQLRSCSPEKYISIRAGKFSLADFFDNNSFSHDPRTQFMNWSLMSNGAWDYPANTRGYTVGAVVEYHAPGGAVRLGATQVPDIANGPVLDNNIARAHGLVAEGEKNISIHKQNGIVRLLLFLNKARMGNYDEAILKNPAFPDLDDSRKYSNYKYGVAISLEQQLNQYAGMFLRAGWNDGRNETWAFTEIDNTLSGGIVYNGKAWKRDNDQIGAAIAVNGLSGPHRRYLAAGGYGFIIGDGRLNYASETIFEVYYSYTVPLLFLSVSPDYQFVLNPAYNKDRGPVHIIGLRAHIEL